MRFRLGVITGFAAGYYLGTAAGRERHEQIKRMLGKVKRSDAYEAVTDKAKASVDLAMERGKDFVEEHTPLGTSQGDLVERATNGAYDTRV